MNYYWLFQRDQLLAAIEYHVRELDQEEQNRVRSTVSEFLEGDAARRHGLRIETKPMETVNG